MHAPLARSIRRSAIGLATLLCVLAPRAAQAESLGLDADLMQDVAALINNEASAAPQSALVPPLGFEVSSHTLAGAGSSPAGKTFGIGLQLGAPTALTIKYMLAPTQGIVVGVGAGFAVRNAFGVGLSLHADYLFHLAELVRNDTVALSFYLGPGLWVSLFNGGYGLGYVGYYYGGSFALFGIGARLPLGLSLAFAAAPIELYLELDPALFVFPGVDFGLGASIGFRFYL